MARKRRTLLEIVSAALVLLCLLGSESGICYITVGGNTWGVWDADSTYYVSHNVIVPLGRTLRIQPGTTVKFDHEKQIQIYGDLQVSGGEELVYFTSMDDDSVGEVIEGSDGVPEPGEWDFILFQVPLSQNSFIRRTHIRYGFYGVLNLGSSVEVDSCDLYRCERYGFFNGCGPPSLSNCRVYHNGLEQGCSGIFSNGSASPDVVACEIYENGGSGFEGTWTLEPFQLTDNLIRDNRRYGIEYYDAVAIPLFSGNLISGHLDRDYGGIRSYPAEIIGNQIALNTYPLLLGGDVSLFSFQGNTISGNSYDRALGLCGPVFGTLPGNLVGLLGAYVVVTGVEIPQYKSLEIESGAIIKLTPFQELQVSGGLSVGSTATDSVVFTSFADDSYGGDTNADGPSSGSPGDWGSISLQETGTSSLRWVHISYALEGIAVNGGGLAIRNSLIGRCQEHGIMVQDGNAAIDSCIITECEDFGIGSSGRSRFYVTNCTITSNGSWVTDAGVFSPGPVAPDVEGCTISFNTGSGIHFENLDSLCGITGNTVENNTFYGILSSGKAPPFFGGNRIVNHTEESQCGILFSCGEVASNQFENNFLPMALTGEIGPLAFESNQFIDNTYNNVLGLKGNLRGELLGVLPGGAGSYLAADSLVVASGDTLLLRSGVVCKFRSSSALRVDGVLLGDGEVENGIVLTSVFDDQFGGDTGPNGPTAGSPGDWRYFIIDRPEAKIDLRHTTVRFPAAGIKSTAGEALLDRCRLSFCSQYGALLDGGDLSLAGCTVDSSESFGLYADSGEVSLTGCQIVGNRAGGVFSPGKIAFTVDSCIVTGNGVDPDANGITCEGPLAPDVISCTIEANSGCGIYCQETQIDFVVSGTVLKDNLQHGIWYRGAARPRFIENQISGHHNQRAAISSSPCRIIDNSIRDNSYPLNITGDLSAFRISGNTITENDYNSALGLTGMVRGVLPGELPDSLIAYVVLDSVTVVSQESLSVEPGAILKFLHNSELRVRGFFKSNGGPDSKIVYTSFSDDRFGGDTNGDGPSAGVPGDWGAITISGGTSNVSLRHSEVYYPKHGFDIVGASPQLADCNIGDCSRYGILVESGSPAVTGGQIRNCLRHGLYSSGSAPFEVSGVRIEGNGESFSNSGIYCSGPGVPNVTDCEIVGNTGPGVIIDGADSVFTFTGNLISDNGLYGIVYSGEAVPQIEGNSFSNHFYPDTLGEKPGVGLLTEAARIASNSFLGNELPILLRGDLSSTVLQNNIFEGNSYQAVGLEGAVNGRIAPPQPFYPYLVVDSLVIGPTDSLRVQEGTIFKFLPGSLVRASGVCRARGSSQEQIVFTSVRDDDFGGDTNGDGPSAGEPGDWEHILIDSHEHHSRWSWCRVRFPRSGFKVSSGVPLLLNCEVEECSRSGVQVEAGAPSLDGGSITGCAQHGIFVETPERVAITGVEVRSNGTGLGHHGVYSSGPTAPGIDSCVIRGNGGAGVFIEQADSGFSILGNAVDSNGTYGLVYLGEALPEISGNSFSYHTGSDRGGSASEALLRPGDSKPAALYSGVLINGGVLFGNLFEGNDLPIILSGALKELIAYSNLFQHNTYHAVGLQAPLSGIMVKTPPGLGAYVVLDSLFVAEGDSLWLCAGTILKFPPGSSCKVRGLFQTTAPADGEVVFTSFSDDDYGGDTNGDGPSSGEPGDWKGITLLSPGVIRLTVPSRVRYPTTGLELGGGEAQIWGGKITQCSLSGLRILEGEPSIVGTEVSNCGRYGLHLLGGSPAVSELKVSSCGKHGVYSSGQSKFVLRDSEITENGSTAAHSGVYSVGPEAPDIIGCVVSANSGDGIHFEEVETAVLIDGNTISENAGSGIDYGGTAVPTITGNVITGHGGGKTESLESHSKLLQSTEITARASELGFNEHEGYRAGAFSSGAVYLNNHFENNYFPIALTGDVESLEVEGNSFQENTFLGLALSGDVSGNLPGEFTDTSLAYLVPEQVTVGGGDTLEIQAGATLRFFDAASFHVFGYLNCEGEPGRRVRFLSTHGDSASPGDWSGLAIQSGGRALMTYCDLSHPERGLGFSGEELFFENGHILFCERQGVVASGQSCRLYRSVIRECGLSGVHISSGEVVLWCDSLQDCGSYGIFSSGEVDFVIDSCLVERSGSAGIRSSGPLAPDVVNSIITGNSGPGMQLDGITEEVLIARNELSDNSGYGIDFAGAGRLNLTGNLISGHHGAKGAAISTGAATVSSNEIRDNTYPLVLTGYLEGTEIIDNLIEGNSYNTVVALSGEVHGGLTEPLATPLTAYLGLDTLLVAMGDTLSLCPGSIIKFVPSGLLKVRGFLETGGDSLGRVVFTSFSDDLHGGDNNNDGPSVGEPGDWVGIWFPDSESGGLVSAADILYPVYGIHTAATSLQVRDCALRLCASYGVYVDEGLPLFLHSLILDCSNYGVYVRSGQPVITGTEIEACGGYGIYSSGETSFTMDSCVVSGNGVSTSSAGVYCDGANPPSILNTTVESNDSVGILMTNAESAFGVEGCAIEGNGDYGIYYRGLAVPTFKGNSIIGHAPSSRERLEFASKAGINTVGAVIDSNEFVGNELAVTVTGDLTDLVLRRNTFRDNVYNTAIGLSGNARGYVPILPLPLTAFVVLDTLKVDSGDTLQVSSGSIFKFSQDVGTRVSGSLAALGSQGHPAIFTSLKDDDYGGDTNNDGSSVGVPGDWNGLFFVGGASGGILSHCRVIYPACGVYTSGDSMRLVSSDFLSCRDYGIQVKSGAARVSHCHVSGCESHGIYVESGQPCLVGSVVDSCGECGIYCSGEAGFLIDSCTVVANSLTGIYCPGPFAPEVSNSVVSGNLGYGIHFSDIGSPFTLSGNTISDNNPGGLFYQGEAVPIITGNTFSGHVPLDAGFGWVSRRGGSALSLSGGGGADLGQYRAGAISEGAVFVNNSFVENLYPLVLSGDLHGLELAGNSYHGNTHDGVALSGAICGVLPGEIDSLQHYLVPEQISVESGDSIHIEAGARLRFFDQSSFMVRGRLRALGDSGRRIVFTLMDEISPGEWGGISIQHGGEAQMRHCELLSAEEGLSFKGSELLMDNCLVSSCSRNGVVLEGGNGIITGTTVQACSLAAVRVIAGEPVINGDTLIDCDGYGLMSLGGVSFLIDSCLVERNGVGIRSVGPLAPEVYGSVIRDNMGSGILFENVGVTTSIRDNQIIGNGASGICCSGQIGVQMVGNIISGHTGPKSGGILSGPAEIRQNSIVGNTYPFVITGDPTGTILGNNLIEENTFNSVIALSQQLKGTLPWPLPSPLGVYLVIDTVEVKGDDKLIVVSGTILKFKPDCFLKMQGFLEADGGPEQQVVFTSFSDDAHGGDSNNDGASTGGPGDWTGLYFARLQGGGQLSNCKIIYPEYGIYALSDVGVDSCDIQSCEDYGVYLDGGSSEVQNSRVSECRSYGIFVEGGQPELRGVGVSGCGGCGIYSSGRSFFTIDSCSVLDNGFTSGSPGIACSGPRAPTVVASRIEGNASNGIEIIGAEDGFSIARCTIDANGDYGIFYTGLAFPTFRGNTITGHAPGRGSSRPLSGNSKIGKVRAFSSSPAGASVSEDKSRGGDDGDRLRAGIYSSAARIDSNTIALNEVSVILTGDIGRTDLENNIFQYSLYNTVLGLSGGVWGTIRSPLPEPITAYLCADTLSVAAGDSLRVRAGSIVKFTSGGCLRAEGRLRVDGSRSNRVVFTSMNDDDYGGDNNANGPSQGSPGDWQGIEVAPSNAPVEVDNALIRYATTGMTIESGEVTISECEFLNNLSQGLRCLGGGVSVDSTCSWHNQIGMMTVNSSPLVTRSVLAHNDYGLHSSEGASPFIGGCDIQDNSLFGVYNADSSITILAENNWWGHYSGPADTSNDPGGDYNPDGLGDKVSDYVDYRPWAVSNNFNIPTPPYPFALISPENSDTLEFMAPTFFWHHTSDPNGEVVRYIWKVADNPDFIGATVVGNLRDTVYTAEQAIVPGGTYWWKVEASDGVLPPVVCEEVFHFEVPDSLPPAGMLVEPHDTLIVIPPQGGKFKYSISIANYTDESLRINAWVVVTLPDSSLYEPFQPYTFNLPPRGVLTYRKAGQKVPGRALGGEYFYGVFIGDYPDSVIDSAGFPFSKSGSADGGIEDWTLTGFGSEQWLKITVEEEPIPDCYGLSQNYPNPFNHSTNFRYQLPQDSYVTMEICNLLGQRVYVLDKEYQTAGYKTFNWRADNLASGVYFYRLCAEGASGESFAKTKKMVIVK